MTQGTGATKGITTFLEVRLGLTRKRPSYRPTGTHPSPRSVLVWRSVIRLTSLSSISRLTLCTHWSLTVNTATPQWVVTRGRRWLVLRLPCRTTVTRKGLMHSSMFGTIREHELVSWLIRKMTAWLVTPESGLVREDTKITPKRVETKQRTGQIKEIDTSKPWVTSWCSDKESENKRFMQTDLKPYPK